VFWNDGTGKLRWNACLFGILSRRSSYSTLAGISWDLTLMVTLLLKPGTEYVWTYAR